jgi:hypothetical protein
MQKFTPQRAVGAPTNEFDALIALRLPLSPPVWRSRTPNAVPGADRDEAATLRPRRALQRRFGHRTQPIHIAAIALTRVCTSPAKVTSNFRTDDRGCPGGRAVRGPQCTPCRHLRRLDRSTSGTSCRKTRLTNPDHAITADPPWLDALRAGNFGCHNELAHPPVRNACHGHADQRMIDPRETAEKVRK